jgi:hypothetical protein
MTDTARSDMPRAMLRHGWLLLLLLFAAALTVSATVHAREALGGTAIFCGGEMHADGDRDEVPADADQGIPHHHGGCHGHVVALEADMLAPAPHPLPGAGAASPRVGTLPSRLIDPALRPPRA